MDPAILRILDANLNRAREGLRVMEEHARMVLNDARLTAEIKQIRHDLADAAKAIGPLQLLSSRDIPGDVGTGISTVAEQMRGSAQAVAAAACKRVAEALRCIEEYGKTIAGDMATQVESIRYRTYTMEQSLLITSPRRKRLCEARLHVLLTEELCKRPWREVVSAAIGGGADVIQLREKSMSDAALLERAVALRELTRAGEVLLIINDRPDIARLCEADGVHLGRGDLPVSAARAIAGPTVLIGATAHTEAEILEAMAADADYIAVGPMFTSLTKPSVEVKGPSLVATAMAVTEVRNGGWPIVAIGGICAANVKQIAGMASNRRTAAVAVCQGVIGQDDPRRAVRELLAEMSQPAAET